jgi:hypothetical protein
MRLRRKQGLISTRFRIGLMGFCVGIANAKNPFRGNLRDYKKGGGMDCIPAPFLLEIQQVFKHTLGIDANDIILCGDSATRGG